MARKKQRRWWLIVVIMLVAVGAWGVFRPHHAAAPKTPTNAKQATDVTSTDKNSKVTFDKAQYSVDDPASLWVVVNKQRPLEPKTYAPSDLTSIGGGRQLRREAAEALQAMISGAKAAGYTVTAASAYRSYDRQVVIYANEVQTYGQTTADSESARPGTSEHQTGWAVDLASGGCSISDCFGTTPGGKWVTEHAAEYGFLLRYPAGKQAITGYRAEAWHFRYIGKALAEEMKKQHILTLEEFFGLPAAPDYPVSE